MRIVSTSYSKTAEFNNPEEWLKRISFYTGILEELAKQHEIISIERINYQGELRQNGVHYCFWKFKSKIARFPVHLHRQIKKLQPDLVFVNGFIFPLQIIQLKIKLGRGVKIIVLHRAEKPFKGVRRYLQKLADKCVNGYFFTSSEFGNEWIKKGIINDRRKIHEVIQASSVFQPGERSTAEALLSINGTPLFLWVGRLASNKDPITVVKAFIDFLSFRPSAKLYMIYQSDDLLREVKELIKGGQNASDSIIPVGEIPHDQLQLWYSCADFIISGSHYEGSGIALSEAMSCGCIPVVTDIISFRRMTGQGQCGLLYKPGDEKDLLKRLLQTINLDVDQEKDKVLQQFSKELSFEVIAKKINEVLSHHINQR